MARDIFISYQQADRAAAERLCSALEERKISCWMAPRDIEPGQEWATAIVQGLKRCHSFVVVLSGHSMDGRQVAREVELADSYGLKMIAFRLEDVEPSQGLSYFLGNVQWLDAFPDRFEKAIEQLEDAIHNADGYPAAITATRRAYRGIRTRPCTSPRWQGRFVWKIAAGVLLAASIGLASYVEVEHVGAERAFATGERELQEKQLPEALASYSRAIALNPKYYLAYCRRATIRHELKQERFALEDIDKALDLNQKCTLAYRVRGDVENGIKQYDLAIRDYTAAIQMNTPDPRGISNVGLAYRGRAQARKALGKTGLAAQDEAAAEALCGAEIAISAHPACG